MGPHKNGIVLNVEQFIKDVEARPAIWNRNYHCNKYFLEQTWQELCKIHKLPATVLKAKWKGLRDNFRVEFKRIPRNPDGQLAMAPEFHQSKWNHFFALQFLINHMRQRGIKIENIAQNDDETVNYDDEECVVEPDIHNVLETCIDDNPEDLETQISNCKRRHQELVNEMNSMGNISMMNGHNLNLTVPVEKKSKLILDNNSCDETLDLTTNKSSRNGNNLNGDSISILNDTQAHQSHNSTNILDTSDSRNSNITINSTSTKTGGCVSGGVGSGGCSGVISNSTPFNNNCLDDDYHFLMSLHPYMQKLNRAKKLRVRTKIQKLIIRELYKRTELQN